VQFRSAGTRCVDDSGSPDFPFICERLLNRRNLIRLTYVDFDLLSFDGKSLMGSHTPSGGGSWKR
jgi:hypothetical protein